MNNNNKISQVSKKGLSFVTNAKHKIRSSIHQGAQVLALPRVGLLTSHRKINQPKQNRNILAPLAHVRFSPDSQQGLRHGLSCTRLCENLSRIGFAKRLRISLFCLVCSIFLGYGFFFSHSAYAVSYIDVSSNGDGTSGSGIVRLGRISPSSTGTQATGSDTLTIHTDCSAGYKVYVSSQENQSTSLVNSNATTPESPSPKDLITAASNVLGENVSSAALTSNTWGINGNSTEASSGLYYGLPSFEDSTSFPLITMSNVAEESTVPIYYGVKVDTSINPGTYSGSVLYTVLINNSCLAYTVVFNPNVDSSSTSEITGEMSDQSIMYGETTALNPNAYTRTGYNFLGWSTTSTGKTGAVVNGIGTTADVDYENEADVLNLVSGGGITTLYAIWEDAIVTFAEAGVAENSNMQSFPSGACDKVSIGQYTTLNDSRDNNKYVIKKLPDGKCWMVQNLRLINKTITSSDSNVSTNFTVPTSTDPTQTAWCKTSDSACDDQPMAYYDSSTRSSYGALYNWYTATAGTGTYSTSSGTVSSSICPKGWRLPTSGSGGEFAALDIAWGGTGSNRTNANTYSTFTGNYNTGNNGGFDLAGFIEGSHFYSVGTNGDLWSSTASSNNAAHFLWLTSNYTRVYPQDNESKYRGDSVRCVVSAGSYTIQFNANGGTGTMSSQTAFNGAGNVLKANTFTRDGYKFLGWSTDSSATSATYTNMQTITSDLAGSGNTITLYAIWERVIDDGNKGNMQTTNICSTIGAGHTATLKDTRDNQTYTVYRFPNTGTAGTNYPTDMAGYCLMTKDLSLGYVTGGSITKGANLSLSTSTSAGSGTITARTGTSNWSDTNDDSNLQYINGQGGTYDSHSYYSYGAAQKVCPKGWRPPTSTEYDNIVTFMGGDNPIGSSEIRSAPYSFVYGGYFYTSGWSNVGSYGYYWSSTQVSSANGYALYFSSSTLGTGNYIKYYGRSVRCISN